MLIAQSNTLDWASMAENAEIGRPLLALLLEIRCPRYLFWGFAREMLNPAWPRLGKPGERSNMDFQGYVGSLGKRRQAGDLSIL